MRTRSFLGELSSGVKYEGFCTCGKGLHSRMILAHVNTSLFPISLRFVRSHARPRIMAPRWFFHAVGNARPAGGLLFCAFFLSSDPYPNFHPARSASSTRRSKMNNETELIRSRQTPTRMSGQPKFHERFVHQIRGAQVILMQRLSLPRTALML